MAKLKTFLDGTSDHDTLGGRIVRAREAIGLSNFSAAEQIGVSQSTYDNWESDRDEPRANKLAMLAGCLSVSPTWLLSGMGEAPVSESVSEELTRIKTHLARVQKLHEDSGRAIVMLQQAVERLSDRET